MDRSGELSPQLIAALGTEHFTLQSARSNTVSESAARASLYLTSVSGGVVALALAAQASRFGPGFFVFAFAILPVLFFLGIVTYYRLLQTGIEDVAYERAIRRVRRLYREIDPGRADYFAEQSLDFVALRAAGIFGVRWQQFVTTAAMVAIVTSVVAGMTVGLAGVRYLGLTSGPATGIGGAAAAICLVGLLTHQRRAWQKFRESWSKRRVSGEGVDALAAGR